MYNSTHGLNPLYNIRRLKAPSQKEMKDHLKSYKQQTRQPNIRIHSTTLAWPFLEYFDWVTKVYFTHFKCKIRLQQIKKKTFTQLI